jgi:hypothetical protein
MLEKQTNEFIDYCKASGFKDKSIKKAPFLTPFPIPPFRIVLESSADLSSLPITLSHV